MSKYETELRRKLASNQADIYETITWFVAAIDIQAYADGKPESPTFRSSNRTFWQKTSNATSANACGGCP